MAKTQTLKPTTQPNEQSVRETQAHRQLQRWRVLFSLALLLVASLSTTGCLAEPEIALNYSLYLPLVAQPPPAYHVAPGGSDSNPGTLTKPWKTIQRAANTLVAGETVIVHAGTYPEIVHETTSGTASTNMITYIADGTVRIRQFYIEGDYIKVEGFTVSPIDCGWEGAIHVSGNYCVVQYNTVQDSGRRGIVVPYPANGCTIRGNTITRANDVGIFIAGTNHLVVDNDVSDIRDHGELCSTGSDANGIVFHGSGHVFRGNYIHDFKKSEQNGQPHVDAFQCWSNLPYHEPAPKDVVIERNHIFMGDTATGKIEEAISGLQGFHAFMIEGAPSDPVQNLTIRNNIVESWSGQNIGGGSGNVSDLKIYNNIFRSSLGIPPSYAPTGVHMAGVTGFEIYNNIFVDFSYRHILIDLGSSGGRYDYNLMWNSDGSTPRLTGYTIQPHDKHGVDPKFVSNFGDLHLQPDSPAIDAGITIAEVTDDYDGNPRPRGPAYDIGPFER